jgi:hypothetical protein
MHCRAVPHAVAVLTRWCLVTRAIKGLTVFSLGCPRPDLPVSLGWAQELDGTGTHGPPVAPEGANSDNDLLGPPLDEEELEAVLMPEGGGDIDPEVRMSAASCALFSLIAAVSCKVSGNRLHCQC